MTLKSGFATLTMAICLFALFGSASEAATLYNFTNFEGPGSGTVAGAGTNMNGIANGGAAVGVGIDNAGNVTNFVRNPDSTFTVLSLNPATNPMAFGINSAGDVAGQDNGAAFFLPPGGPEQTLSVATAPSTGFGINDLGNIVGQYTLGAATPVFYLPSNTSSNLITINAPSGSGSNAVNAQGVNDNGLIVGFYLGNDGQVHGFTANVAGASGSMLTGAAVADPNIPNNPGEPGATFVFSQILGINNSGIAVGYYGDSTTSQHGFLYNTNTGKYTFLDDPSAAFSNGVEVTQLTGINNTGEITGFYSDANGVFHGFVASATPEPVSFSLTGLGLLAAWVVKRRKGSAARLSRGI